jgi:hypothetical protein
MFFHEMYDVARNPLFANKAKQTSTYFNAEGVPKTKEHKLKIQEALRGKPKSKEHRRKCSIAKKGRPASEACRLAQIKAVKGKPKSAEHRRKIREASKGQVKGPEARAKMSKRRTENNLGRCWWVNSDGQTKFQTDCPGPEWRKGRK